MAKQVHLRSNILICVYLNTYALLVTIFTLLANNFFKAIALPEYDFITTVIVFFSFLYV